MLFDEDPMIHFLPLAIRYDGPVASGDHGDPIPIGPMLSGSRDCVRLGSEDPSVLPRMRFDDLSTEQDPRE